MNIKTYSIMLLLSVMTFCAYPASECSAATPKSKSEFRSKSKSTTKLVVPKLQSSTLSSFEAAALELHSVDQLNWKSEFPLCPDVKFKIAHSNENIYLRFYVEENSIRALSLNDEDSMSYQDSCVEFFIAFDDSNYYNIECNCVGSILFGKGPVRENREHLPVAQSSQIERITTLPHSKIESQRGDFKWSVTLIVPVNILGIDPDEGLSGRVARGNFFKCGDLTPETHYLSWSPIDAPSPDFHIPAFFGELLFE